VEGKKSTHWLKIKYRRRISCAVGGCTLKEGHLSALLLGLYSADGRFAYIGRAGSGLSGEQIRQLEQYFRNGSIEPSPFQPAPRIYGVKTVWCRPELVCVVEYQEWTEDLGLRAPVISGFSDRPAGDCVFE
jgi:ATP-dependent DNA ligase